VPSTLGSCHHRTRRHHHPCVYIFFSAGHGAAIIPGREGGLSHAPSDIYN
jgi:hypothetical protein